MKYQNPYPVDVDAAALHLPQWREFYSDPFLQELLDSAIAHNTDLSTAALRLSQADENVKASKLAYTPSFVFFSFFD